MAVVGTLANSTVDQAWAGVDKPLLVLAITLEKQKKLKADLGGMDKELTNAGFKNKDDIPVIHLELGVSRSVGAGSSASSGKPEFKSLRFVASIDSYVALLMQACVSGEKVTSAVFSYVAHSGNKNEVVMKVTLEDGYVNDVEIIDGLMYCQLNTRKLSIDNNANKPFTTEFYDQ